jgi:hypothetical protein
MRKKPLILVTLLLFALTAVGVGNALWSDELYIEGIVFTGEVDVDWSFVGCFDVEGKDVGYVEGWIDEYDPNLLHYYVDNAYPFYVADCELEYIVVGSIPVHVEMIEFLPGGLTGCDVVQHGNGSFVATCDQMIVTWADGLCTQLHQGDFQAASLRIEILQEAEQGALYDFGLRVQFNQYNESSCPIAIP